MRIEKYSLSLSLGVRVVPEQSGDLRGQQYGDLGGFGTGI